jgi:hypothetical protein
MMEPLKILSLRVDYRESESPEPWPNVKYAIINCVFKCDRVDDPGEDFAWWQAKGESEEFYRILAIDDPSRYENWLTDPNGWNFSSKYDGYSKVWTHRDPAWRHIEKFDVFWFRSWSSDSPVTRAIIHELEFFKEHGRLPSVYRAVDSCIVLSHMRVLGETYWD